MEAKDLTYEVRGINFQYAVLLWTEMMGSWEAVKLPEKTVHNFVVITLDCLWHFPRAKYVECHTNKWRSAREVFPRRFGLPVQAFCLFLGLLGPLSASIVYFLLRQWTPTPKPPCQLKARTKGRSRLRSRVGPAWQTLWHHSGCPRWSWRCSWRTACPALSPPYRRLVWHTIHKSLLQGQGGEGLKISTGAFVKIWWLGSELHLADLNPSTPWKCTCHLLNLFTNISLAVQPSSLSIICKIVSHVRWESM